MAFVPAKRQVASTPISAAFYDEDGKKVEIKFTAHYRRQKKSQLDDLADGLANRYRLARGEEPIRREGGIIPTAEDGTDAEFLGRYLSGWTGVKNEDGSDKPCTPETISSLLEDYPELNRPLVDGFWQAHRGVIEKN